MTGEDEIYENEFKKQLKIFGLENEGIEFQFKYICGDVERDGFNPTGIRELWVDITIGAPSASSFRRTVRHELKHKQKELRGKKGKWYYDEIEATLAEYFDIFASDVPFWRRDR